MQLRIASFGLLVGAAVLHLPVAYQIVRDSGSVESASFASAIAMGIGLVGMGLAWCAGCSLEGRRLGSVRALVAVGVLEGVLGFFPALQLHVGERALLAGAAVLSLGALFVIRPTEASARA